MTGPSPSVRVWTHGAIMGVGWALLVSAMVISWRSDPGLCDPLLEGDPYACVGRNVSGVRDLWLIATVEWLVAAVVTWPTGPFRILRALTVVLCVGLMSVPLLFGQLHGGPITLFHLLGLWCLVLVSLLHVLEAILWVVVRRLQDPSDGTGLVAEVDPLLDPKDPWAP